MGGNIPELRLGQPRGMTAPASGGDDDMHTLNVLRAGEIVGRSYTKAFEQMQTFSTKTVRMVAACSFTILGEILKPSSNARTSPGEPANHLQKCRIHLMILHKACTATDSCILQHVVASPAQPDNQRKPACGICKADVGLQERLILAYGGSHSPADGPPVRGHPDERVQV